MADIHGPETGFDVEIFTPSVSEPIPPRAPMERTDADLAPGVRERVRIEQPGYAVSMHRVVTANGATLLDSTFDSYYLPQAEIWKSGPPPS